MSGHEDKGKRYISLLEAARVNGNWTEVPELVRKVTKHASHEKTLIQTATAEHFVASNTGRRPQTSTTTSGDCVETLRETVRSAQNALAEEIFQGRTCLTWAAWTGVTKSAADSVLLTDVVALFDKYGQKNTSQWTKICLLKVALFKAKEGPAQAIVVYRAAAAWIELDFELVKSVPQMSFWAEKLLAEYALLATETISTETRQKAFQSWAILAKSPQSSSTNYGYTSSHPSRDEVWAAYYKLASNTLRHSQQATSASRTAQAAQLRTIESAYESSFLRNRKFPKATESNAGVEEWVESVIQNWLILCGPGWREEELGHGRNGVTRNVLDILYRAAMVTFHSTLILRRLFQVHKSLAEFYLAYSCLDTYIELVDRDRERALKAGQPTQESDEVMLSTIAEGIEGLCAYGQQKEAEKAFNLACKLEDWLADNEPDNEEDDMNQLPNGHNDVDSAQVAISAIRPSDYALQIVYRAIGIAKANWAQRTPFNEIRSDLQAEALAALKTAVGISQPQIPTLYALALLCAEMRQIPQALRWTKVALQKSTGADLSLSVPAHCALWHLLTLLLTSQQDFETALQSSTATLDSIMSTIVPNRQNGSLEKTIGGSMTYPVVADFECDDLEKLTALQVTYMALVELVDGPEAALNRSGELLCFYSTLFKRFEVDLNKSPADHLIPPGTSAGTLKSVKGSVFSRRKATPSMAPSTTAASVISEAYTDKSARPMTQASQAPTIQVTDESGKPPDKKHHHSLVHRHRHHDDTKKAGDLSPPATAKTIKGSEQRDFGAATNGSNNNEIPPVSIGRSLDAEPAPNASTKQPLTQMDHNLTSHDEAPPPLGHADQPPEQDTRLPHVNSHSSSTSPIPRAPKAAGQKHALAVLVKMWLTVTTLYRRCNMFEDARESCEEAGKAAARVESLVAAADPSARALGEVGWGGGGKSSDQIWADIYCAKAELLHAIISRRAEEGTPAKSENFREVVELYEHCLMYEPNHAGGVIGISNILLDYYDRKIDLAKKVDDGRSLDTRPTSRSGKDDDVLGSTTPVQERLLDPFYFGTGSGEDLKKTPENLNRIAARDRAYGLLNTLSKLGNGWDDSETWFALARAHELGGEIDKAKNILWWCIELEDTRPIRHWSNLGCGGYVL